LLTTVASWFEATNSSYLIHKFAYVNKILVLNGMLGLGLTHPQFYQTKCIYCSRRSSAEIWIQNLRANLQISFSHQTVGATQYYIA